MADSERFFSGEILTLKLCVSEVAQHLASAGIDSARLDAECLISHVLERPRSYLYAYADIEIEALYLDKIREVLARRLSGEPVAYILGEKEFWSMSMNVGPGVLIPRPDTECLVECVLDLPLPDDAGVVDLGTGTGAMAIALAKERPCWHVCAVDKSPQALAYAAQNRRRHAVDQTSIIGADWLSAFAGECFHAVIANPPYIDELDPHLMCGDVRFEPRSALVASDRGMHDLRVIADHARRCLRRDGYLVLEHGYRQGPATKSLLKSLGYSAATTLSDIAGNPRASLARWQRPDRDGV